MRIRAISVFALRCLTWTLAGALQAQTSPKGTFKIESATKPAQPPVEGNDVADFVVSTTDPNVKELLNEHPDTTNVSYFISPDEKSIFGSSSYGRRMAGGDLFKRGDGLKFKPVKPQSLAELAWRFFAQQEKIDPEKVPFLQDEIGIIDFVAWSPDSGRLLVALRGGDFDENDQQRGVYLWYAYFNTRTKSFELTDYLRRLNKGAWKRFKDEKLRANFGEAASAEPLTELPSVAELKKQYDQADHRLNEVYQQVLPKIVEDQKTAFRDDQGHWIKTRDLGAKLYKESGAESTAERRYWQYMLDSTQAQLRHIETDWKPTTERQ